MISTKHKPTILVGLILFVAESLIITAASNDSSGNDKRVEVGVYFESKCPDSRNFFLNQLLPTYRALGNETIKLVLVPFGHARVLSKDKMICQHGQRECEGNKLMACMLGQGSSDGEVLEAMGCLFENKLSPKECINKHMGASTQFDEVDKCAKDNKRTYELMLEAEKLTGRVSYIPHLTMDGQSSDEVQQRAEWHLKEYVCSLYKPTPAPKACKDANLHTARRRAHSSSGSGYHNDYRYDPYLHRRQMEKKLAWW